MWLLGCFGNLLAIMYDGPVGQKTVYGDCATVLQEELVIMSSRNSTPSTPGKTPSKLTWAGLILAPLAILLAVSMLASIPLVPGAVQETASPSPVIEQQEPVLPVPDEAPLLAPELDTLTYLPTVESYRAPGQSVFGVEINTGLGSALAETAADAGVSWVRYGVVRWDEIESVQGQRNWDLLSGLDQDLAALQAQGLNTEMVVLGTPDWARKYPSATPQDRGRDCGAIGEAYFSDFASFMQEVVRRYSGSPYYVKYWELGNEPDVDPAFSSADQKNLYGCWGEMGDPYYGGGYYAAMLKTVYPAIKAVAPQAQVMIGGLLLDCDPTHPPANSVDGCLPGKFFEGILRAGGGAYFDMATYHAYTYWRNDGLDSDLTHGKWAVRGGAVLGKASLLREVMAQYGVNKPLLMNEGGLLCYPTNSACPGELFQHGQAVGLVKLYTRTWANDIEGAIWYTLNGPGWRDGGLLEGDKSPRPAYTSLSFMADLLKNAHFVASTITAQAESYEFEDATHLYQLHWTNSTDLTVQIQNAANLQSVYDIYGQSVVHDELTLPVSFDPVIVVLSK